VGKPGVCIGDISRFAYLGVISVAETNIFVAEA
jgi:hypothetical protein